jgi:predicted tellurium resistance membrane protein TerC
MEWIVPLITLILLEVVLGLDNIIFISIVAARLPEHQQNKARKLGIILAMVMRLALLGVISLILKLDGNLFTVFSINISGKDIILILGGLFLIYKSASEIHHKMEGESGDTQKNIKASTFKQVIIQILLLDLVFSVDSIITAVGMVSELWIMYVAVITSVAIMFFASGPISSFVNRHPAFKMLALSFLLLIGVSLIGEGLDMHIPKGYIYFSMSFALLVDIIQMRSTKNAGLPVETKEHYLPNETGKMDS